MTYYSTSSNLRIYRRIGKNVFHWEKLNFEHIGNSVYTTEFLALQSALNNCIDYLMFYPNRCQIKALQVQVYIQ